MFSNDSTAAARSKRGDEKILSYHDVVLRRSDLDILGGPHYINDRILEFYFAYLSSSTTTSSSSGGAAPLLLVPPSISFWIANCPDLESLHDAVAPLRLRDRDLILFTVNDNTDVSLAEGGAHWSLLAYDRRSDEYVHHDSSPGMNRRHAERLYKAVRFFVGDSGGRLVERPTPRQTNGYDCGLHVVAAARAICGWREGGPNGDHDRWFPALGKEAAAVVELRGEVLRLIRNLMEQQKK